ncbi:hypothetical protein SYNPS1DRAFT_28550 [Syncephalis pseudoplumigaleata]|uniref:DH domain-containing protein n=1 Tax=Syncephalis pseudoplumigaleata TaxID=1712513 RepID=A0A4P9Z003_9FUNG|nr:hypothetical protein SYNPS1DRAFT_28550 [Syncephalis pseudoplumigaleata]|eukprot:RKP25726.1 hypothetical protein SYNPS1DRAFT_28550 [Syncephalis pseudoplumigaleata]
MSLESVYTTLPALFSNLGLDGIGKNEVEPQKSSSSSATANSAAKQLADTDITAATTAANGIDATARDHRLLSTEWGAAERVPALLATARADDLLTPAERAQTDEPYAASPTDRLDIQRQMSTCSSASSTGSLPHSRPHRFERHTCQYDDDMHAQTARSARDVARRLHAFKELLDTERRYVRDLGILVEVFLMPLSSIAWITGEQKRAVIRNAWVIRGCHAVLLKELEDVITNIIDGLPQKASLHADAATASPDGHKHDAAAEKSLPSLPAHVTLGRVFLDHANNFHSYIEYCSGHDMTLRVLAQLAEHAKWRSFTKSCKDQLRSQNLETRLTIHDYLIKPVQRLCQYPIIMRELMSFYTEGTREHGELREAIDMLRGVATSVDDAKHLEEARQRTQLFLSRVDEISMQADPLAQLSAYPDIMHYRNDGLLLAGALEFIDYNRGVRLCTKYYGCFVFPGLLLVARAQRARTYRILHRFPLTDMLLMELSAAQSLLRYPWRLQCIKTRRNFDFGAAGQQERKLWFDLLSRYTTQLRLRHRNDSTSSIESMASDLGMGQLPMGDRCYRTEPGLVDICSGASDATLVEGSSLSSRQSRSSAKSEDSTTSSATCVPKPSARTTELSRRYSHGNHDLHHPSNRKGMDILSPVSEKASGAPSPDQSLVRRMLPLRRTQSVEFRNLHGSAMLSVDDGGNSCGNANANGSSSSSSSNMLRAKEMSGPPSPLRSQWSFRSSSGTDTPPARRITIEQRFEDVFTQDHQTVHALEMRLQQVAEQSRQQRMQAENDTPDQHARHNLGVPEGEQRPGKRRVQSETVPPASTVDAPPPRVPQRTSSLRQMNAARPASDANERPLLKIAHHSLSLTLSSVRLIAGAAARASPADSAETTDDEQHAQHTPAGQEPHLHRYMSTGRLPRSTPSSPIIRPRSVNSRAKRINSLLFSSSLRINTDVGETGSAGQQMHQRSLSVQRSLPQLSFGRTRPTTPGAASSSPMRSMTSLQDDIDAPSGKDAATAKHTAVARLLRSTFRRARPQSTPPPSPSEATLLERVSTPFMSRSTLAPEQRPRPRMQHATEAAHGTATSMRRHSAHSLSSANSEEGADRHDHRREVAAAPPHSPMGMQHHNLPIAAKFGNA